MAVSYLLSAHFHINEVLVFTGGCSDHADHFTIPCGGEWIEDFRKTGCQYIFSLGVEYLVCCFSDEFILPIDHLERYSLRDTISMADDYFSENLFQ